MLGEKAPTRAAALTPGEGHRSWGHGGPCRRQARRHSAGAGALTRPRGSSRLQGRGSAGPRSATLLRAAPSGPARPGSAAPQNGSPAGPARSRPYWPCSKGSAKKLRSDWPAALRSLGQPPRLQFLLAERFAETVATAWLGAVERRAAAAGIGRRTAALIGGGRSGAGRGAARPGFVVRGRLAGGGRCCRR